MNLKEFEALAKSRRAIRYFKSDPIPDDLLRRVLDAAHWSPSGYNLQPTHFFLAKDTEVKKDLHKACLGQRQIIEAPVIVALTGDRRVYPSHLEKIVDSDMKSGAMDERYAGILRRNVKLAFDQGPMGLGWLGKACLAPFFRLLRPMPSIPAVDKSFWLTKQVMLSAMTLMLAAEAAGLSSSPMEGFDEGRVKRVLHIPSSHVVSIVIALGYAKERSVKSRLPLQDLLHEVHH
jgi:nitroreductase